jgi:ribosomal protein S18 acetylase RimI-like enzyme
MVVRRATLDNARAIATIHVHSWQAAYAGIVPDAFLRSLSIESREAAWRTILEASASETHVVEEREELVGWISIGTSRDPDAPLTTGEVWALYVAPECWRRGAGRALWSRGHAALKTAGFLDATLWVLQHNRQARRFYESAGFVPDPGQDKTIELGGVELLEIRLRRRVGG